MTLKIPVKVSVEDITDAMSYCIQPHVFQSVESVSKSVISLYDGEHTLQQTEVEHDTHVKSCLSQELQLLTSY